MAFLLDDAYLPATLTAGPMTDEQLAELCAEHPELSFEMTAEGELIVSAAAFYMTGFRNSRVTAALHGWADADRRGVCADSSIGCVLPNGARRSPDASWTLRSRLPARLDRAYLRLCPDFVIEIRSKTDRLPQLRAKIAEYIANGAQLGWLIDPHRRAVEVYRPGRDPEILAGIDRVEGEGPVAGFVLDLKRIWDPLGSD